MAVKSFVYLHFMVQFRCTKSLCKVLNKYEENFKYIFNRIEKRLNSVSMASFA